MNEEPPAELAAIVAKNSHMNGRKRLQKLCDTILADATGIRNIFKSTQIQMHEIFFIEIRFFCKIGLPVQSDLDAKLSALITRQLVPLRQLARSVVRAIDPDDDLICLRVGSDAKEYFIMWDDQFLLASIQKIDTMGKEVFSKPGYTPDSPRLYG